MFQFHAIFHPWDKTLQGTPLWDVKNYHIILYFCIFPVVNFHAQIRKEPIWSNLVIGETWAFSTQSIWFNLHVCPKSLDISVLADKIRRHVRQHGCFWQHLLAAVSNIWDNLKAVLLRFWSLLPLPRMFFFSSSSDSSHKVAASVVQFASSFGTMIVAVHLKLLILAPCPRLFLAFCKACEELTTPLVAPIECYLMFDRGISSSKLRLLSISYLFDRFFGKYSHQKNEPKVAWYGFGWLHLRGQNPTKHGQISGFCLGIQQTPERDLDKSW